MSKQKLISDSRIRTMVSLIDLTDLSDNCDPAAIDILCHQARTPVADVAAVCIWPTFIAQAKNNLGPSSSVKVATVVNFPAGDHSLDTVCAAIDKALDDGADEIDYVMPYRELINGNVLPVASALKAVRNQVPDNKKLKTILETGELSNEELIRTAATIAIDQGADFIKTSTGESTDQCNRRVGKSHARHDSERKKQRRVQSGRWDKNPVSYTHLTLPTILLV